MRGATSITLQPHQMLPLPRKMMRIIDCRRIWNVIYNARSNRHHPPTSPNTAPATQNCTPKSKKNLPKTAEASILMRGRFEHDPSMIRAWSEHESEHELVISHPPVRRAYFSRFGDAFCIENYNISRSGYLSKFHQILRLPRKLTLQDHQYCACHAKWLSWLMSVTHDTSFTMRGATDLILQHHQMLRLPRKMTRIIHPRDIWNVIYAEEQASPANLTKYCACHAKWLSWLIFITYETSFTMRGATGITLQPHQILRLPRKSALQNLSEILRKRLKRQFQCGDDSSMIRPWSEHESEHELVISHPPVRQASFSRFRDAFCIENYNISRSGYLSKFHQILCLPRKVITKYCACHEKWHSKITKCCACHEKWHSDITKCCPCHEKWHSDITKYCACHEKWRSDITKCCACHEKWHSDITKYWACHDKWDCHWTVTELSCYEAVTELLLNCYWTDTGLSLNCSWAVTELLLNWAVTELLLNWTVTELLLDCHSTVTELTCYWAVTQLSCYWTVTELLLNWPVTELLLNCYFALLLELLLYWTLCIFKSP